MCCGFAERLERGSAAATSRGGAVTPDGGSGN